MFFIKIHCNFFNWLKLVSIFIFLYKTFGGKEDNLDEVFKTGHKMILGKIAKSAFYEVSSEVAAQEINNMID